MGKKIKKQPGELINHENQKCLLCDKAHIRSILISTSEGQFILCPTCEIELAETIQGKN